MEQVGREMTVGSAAPVGRGNGLVLLHPQAKGDARNRGLKSKDENSIVLDIIFWFTH